MLGGGGGGDEGAGGEASGTQLQTTAEADAALDAAIESTIGALLESDGFGRLAESVVESEQRLVHNVESGDLCGDATTPSEMTARAAARRRDVRRAHPRVRTGRRRRCSAALGSAAAAGSARW